jgi:hypothetical protein
MNKKGVKIVQSEQQKPKTKERGLKRNQSESVIDEKSLKQVKRESKQSLRELAEKLFRLMRDGAKVEEQNKIDLKQIATQFGTRKRRIYDITTVFEKIGLVEKYDKNNFAWKGVPEAKDKQVARATWKQAGNEDESYSYIPLFGAIQGCGSKKIIELMTTFLNGKAKKRQIGICLIEEVIHVVNKKPKTINEV